MRVNTCKTDQRFLMHKRPTLHGKNWPVWTYMVRTLEAYSFTSKHHSGVTGKAPVPKRAGSVSNWRAKIWWCHMSRLVSYLAVLGCFGGKETLSGWCAFLNRYKSPLKKWSLWFIDQTSTGILLNLQTWGIKQGMPCLKAHHLTPNPGTGQKGGHLLGKWWNNHRALAADGGWLRELELGWNVKNPDASWGINKNSYQNLAQAHLRLEWVEIPIWQQWGFKKSFITPRWHHVPCCFCRATDPPVDQERYKRWNRKTKVCFLVQLWGVG